MNVTKPTRFYPLFLAWLLTLFVGCRAEAPSVTPAEAAQRVAAGKALLIDVREPAEWEATGVAAPAYLLALSDLRGERREWKAFLAANKERELLLYCRSGNRSGQAANLLAQEGFKTVNVGGFAAWQKAGLPTRTAKEPRR